MSEQQRRLPRAAAGVEVLAARLADAATRTALRRSEPAGDSGPQDASRDLGTPPSQAGRSAAGPLQRGADRRLSRRRDGDQ